ncbi:MAG TPA: GntR family transcriptional regulator [Pseudonocardia sp.]|jgi:DNA-binding GntR family transcriptional regulator
MTADAVRRVTAITMVDQVTSEIRRSIVSGALLPGQELSLRELAARLGVSTIPVREGLRRLEGQGLLTGSAGPSGRRSIRVAPLDAEDLHGIYRLRLALEPEIAGRACLLVSDAELDELAALARSFGAEHFGVDEMYQSHHDLHLRLLAPAATTWDVRTLENLWNAGERYVRLAFGARDDLGDEHHRREHAHLALIEGYRTRSPDHVRALVRHHLEDNEAIAREAIAPAH